MLEPPFTWALQNSMIPIQFTCVKNEYWLPIGKHVNSKAINSNLSTPVLKIRVCSTSLLKQVLELALFLNGCNAIKLCVSVSYLLPPPFDGAHATTPTTIHFSSLNNVRHFLMKCSLIKKFGWVCSCLFHFSFVGGLYHLEYTGQSNPLWPKSLLTSIYMDF